MSSTGFSKNSFENARDPIVANAPTSYSAVSPNNGNIISGHGHYDFTAGGGGARIRIYAANYTTNTNSLIQNGILGGVGIISRTLIPPITVSAGDEIGIYIEDSLGGGNFAPAGTGTAAFMLEACLILQ